MLLLTMVYENAGHVFERLFIVAGSGLNSKFYFPGHYLLPPPQPADEGFRTLNVKTKNSHFTKAFRNRLGEIEGNSDVKKILQKKFDNNCTFTTAICQQLLVPTLDLSTTCLAIPLSCSWSPPFSLGPNY